MTQRDEKHTPRYTIIHGLHILENPSPAQSRGWWARLGEVLSFTRQTRPDPAPQPQRPDPER